MISIFPRDLPEESPQKRDPSLDAIDLSAIAPNELVRIGGEHTVPMQFILDAVPQAAWDVVQRHKMTDEIRKLCDSVSAKASSDTPVNSIFTHTLICEIRDTVIDILAEHPGLPEPTRILLRNFESMREYIPAPLKLFHDSLFEYVSRHLTELLEQAKRQ